MDTINLLKELINEDVFVRLEKVSKGKFSCKLTENNAEKPYSLKLVDLPDDTLVMNCEKFPNTGSFFKDDNDRRGIRKRADYIVFNERKKVVLVIEMKRTSNTRFKIIQQLKGAKCIVDYCKSIVSEFFNNDGFLSGYRYRYYCYKSITLRKSGAYGDKNVLMGPNYEPEEFRKITDSETHFRKLLINI